MNKPQMHPDMQILIAARDAAGPKGETPQQQRKFWFAYSRALNEAHPADMKVWDEIVETAEHNVPVRLYRPAGLTDPAPVIMYMHGGGFMLGDLDSSDSVAWGFAQQAGAVVVSVDYRLTPEHPYPAAFNDCWGTLLWLTGHAARLNIDSNRIAVAGDSAGGNLGAAMALKARDSGALKLTCAAIIYPGTGLDQGQPSYTEFADGPGLTRAGTIKYRDLYLPNDRDTDDPYARPVMARDFSGLPPFWVHSAQIDPIRDDGRVFASKLALAGVDVTYREARGMIHGFMRARFKGRAAAREYDLICDFLKRHLHEG